MTVRVNGQHSSKMFLGLTSESWAQVQFPVVINRSHYTCDTRQDMPALFRHFDQAWQTRNTRDNIGAYISANDQLHGKVDGDITTTLSRGLVFHEKRLLGIKSGADRRFAVISEPRYHPVLCWGSQALSPTRTQDMLLPAVVAAMAHTMMSGDERVMTFWQTWQLGQPTVMWTVRNINSGGFWRTCGSINAGIGRRHMCPCFLVANADRPMRISLPRVCGP